MQYGERGLHSGTKKRFPQTPTSPKNFETVEPVSGEAKNDHVEFVLFGDLMKDRRHTLRSIHIIVFHRNLRSVSGHAPVSTDITRRHGTRPRFY